jgi:hypothetical protein
MPLVIVRVTGKEISMFRFELTGAPVMGNVAYFTTESLCKGLWM